MGLTLRLSCYTSPNFIQINSLLQYVYWVESLRQGFTVQKKSLQQEHRQQSTWLAGFVLWTRWLHCTANWDHSLNLLLKPPSCGFCPLLWHSIHHSSLVPSNLLTQPWPQSHSPSVSLFQRLCPLRIPVQVLPDSPGPASQRSSLRKRFTLLGWEESSSALPVIQNTTFSVPQVYFVPPPGWNKPPPQLNHPCSFPILANTFHIPPFIWTLFLFQGWFAFEVFP